MPRLRERVPPAAGLWIAWPKRASGVETDLTEDVVRELALANRLVDNKVAAVDATWSALRLVIPLKDRPCWAAPGGRRAAPRGPAPQADLLQGVRAPRGPRGDSGAAVDPDARPGRPAADRVRLRAGAAAGVPGRLGADRRRPAAGRVGGAPRRARAAGPRRAARPLPDPVPDRQRRRDRRGPADGGDQLARGRAVRRGRAAHRA